MPEELPQFIEGKYHIDLSRFILLGNARTNENRFHTFSVYVLYHPCCCHHRRNNRSQRVDQFRIIMLNVVNYSRAIGRKIVFLLFRVKQLTVFNSNKVGTESNFTALLLSPDSIIWIARIALAACSRASLSSGSCIIATTSATLWSAWRSLKTEPNAMPSKRVAINLINFFKREVAPLH